MAVSDFFPDPGTGSTTVDGSVLRFNGSGEDWGVMRAGAGTISSAGSSFSNFSVECDANTDKYDIFRRLIYTLDTSALTSGASISGAVFSVVGRTKKDELDPDSIALVGSTPNVNNDLQISDYGQLGTTLYATAVALSGITIDQATYTDLTMNPTGIAAIVKDGITGLGLRIESDRSNTEQTWASGLDAGLTVYMADETGTDKDPRLRVTHSAGGTLHQVTFAITAVAVVGLSRKVSRVLPIVSVNVVGLTRKVFKTLAITSVAVVGLGRRIKKTLAIIVKAVIGFAHDGDVVPPWDLDASLHLEGQAITRHAIENQAITRHTTEQQAMVRHDLEQLS